MEGDQVSQGHAKEGDVQRATTEAAIDLSLDLVYQEYRREGYYTADEEKGGYFARFLRSEEATTFQFVEAGQVVGTISLIEDSSRGLPMDVQYHFELESLRQRGKKLAEVSQFAVRRDLREDSTPRMSGVARLQVSGALFSAILRHALARKIDSLVISVHPKHDEFYTQVGFSSLGGVKTYEVVRTQAVAKALDLHHVMTPEDGVRRSFIWRMIMDTSRNTEKENEAREFQD